MKQSVCLLLLASLPCAAGTGSAPLRDDPPGCALQATLAACMEDVDNGAEMLRCVQPALDGARRELAGVRERVERALHERAGLRAALAAADGAWEPYMLRDCESMSIDWDGGAMRRGVVADCLYRHTLQRAQLLWTRHLARGDDAVPVSCVVAP